MADGFVRGKSQIDEVMRETARVGAPRPVRTAADRVPKVRKDPDAPMQERQRIRDLEAKKENRPAFTPPPTAGRRSFGVDYGD